MNTKIIDGHSDVLTRMLRSTELSAESFFSGWPNRHIDFPRLQKSNVRVLISAVFVPNAQGYLARPVQTKDGHRIPFAPAIDKTYAQISTDKMLNLYNELILVGAGRLVPITERKTLQEVLEGENRGSVLMFEGADMIEPDLSNLEHYYNSGLRILSLTWSRENSFATGTPYEIPGHPDQGPGLSDYGRALVQKCRSMGILVDVSHLNAKGFWDVLQGSEKPVVATHSGVHAICPCPRNLTDEQLKAIAKTGGLVGITFSTSEIRADGRLDVETPVSEIVEHVMHAINVIGLDHVAFGSDFDGTVIPDEIKDICGYSVLIDSLRATGIQSEDLEKISYKNWQRVLESVLK